MTTEKRVYRKGRRAELEARTRERIVESAVALHGTIGPSRTSLSAIADRAGVPRSTLYRHFADEDAVFDACSAHWAQRHPLPDPASWAAIGDPDERLSTALKEIYGFYAANAQMLENLYRDAVTMPVVARQFAGFGDYLAAVADSLIVGRRVRGRARSRLRAVIGHALAFGTWRSLTVDQALPVPEAVSLMVSLGRALSAR